VSDFVSATVTKQSKQRAACSVRIALNNAFVKLPKHCYIFNTVLYTIDQRRILFTKMLKNVVGLLLYNND